MRRSGAKMNKDINMHFFAWHFLWTFVIKAIWTFSDLKQFLAFYFKKCTSWGLLSVVLVANFEKAWRPNKQRYQILFLHAHTSKNSFYKWTKIIISRVDILVHLQQVFEGKRHGVHPQNGIPGFSLHFPKEP